MKIGIVLAGLILFGSYGTASFQMCNTRIVHTNESITRAFRYIKVFDDKKRAMEEIQDAISSAQDAMVDCVRSPGIAKAAYKRAKRAEEKIRNYETKDEYMRRIKRERGIGD